MKAERNIAGALVRPPDQRKMPIYYSVPTKNDNQLMVI